MTHENPDISTQENYTPSNKDQLEILFRFNGFPCMKRAVEIAFRKADADGVCATKEGPVSYQAGDTLMTGTQGETWPIAADKFAATYDIVRDGIASKKAIPVQGAELALPTEIQASWGVLRGKPGDIVVRYGEGDYGIVSRDIFEETYARVGGEPMASKDPGTDITDLYDSVASIRNRHGAIIHILTTSHGLLETFSEAARRYAENYDVEGAHILNMAHLEKGQKLVLVSGKGEVVGEISPEDLQSQYPSNAVVVSESQAKSSVHMKSLKQLLGGENPNLVSAHLGKKVPFADHGGYRPKVEFDFAKVGDRIMQRAAKRNDYKNDAHDDPFGGMSEF